MVLFTRGERGHISGLPWGKMRKDETKEQKVRDVFSLKSLKTFCELQHGEGNL